MIGCLGQSRADQSRLAQDSDVMARAVAAVALAALAVIHVFDLPDALGPRPLVGLGYFGIIAVATLAGGLIVARSHWLAWAVAGRAGVPGRAGSALRTGSAGPVCFAPCPGGPQAGLTRTGRFARSTEAHAAWPVSYPR